MANKVQYWSVKTSDNLTEREEEEGKSHLNPEGRRLRSWKDILFNSCQPVQWQGKFAAFLYILSGVLLLATSRFPTEKQCTRKMSTWSPMIEAVEYEWIIWDVESPSKYTGKPTKDIEREWDYLWQYGSLGIPESKLGLLNKSRDEDWLHTPLELGGGVTALFEVFHQIHCLNLVRQYTYRDEYDYDGLPAFDQSPVKLLDHIEHCIEMLRIDLMCFSDETPYLILVDKHGEEVVHTNSLHRCRKFGRLIDWAKNHIAEPYNATLELKKHADEHYKKNLSTVIETPTI